MLASTDASTSPLTFTLTRPRPGLALVTLGGEIDRAAIDRLRAVLSSAPTCAEVVVVVIDAAAVEGGRAGGCTVLALHGEEGPASLAVTIDHLRIAHRDVAPTHPGWAGNARAASLNGVGALARAHLDLLAETDARDVVVVGASFGAWRAARMPLDDVEGRVAALVLMGPIGLRVPGEAVPAPAAVVARCGRRARPRRAGGRGAGCPRRPRRSRPGADKPAGRGTPALAPGPAAPVRRHRGLPVPTTAGPHRGGRHGVNASTPTTDEEILMRTTSSHPDHHAPETDAEIDAAVRAFMIDLTGPRQPVDALVERYARAMETIAEQVTEMLATMANHR